LNVAHAITHLCKEPVTNNMQASGDHFKTEVKKTFEIVLFLIGCTSAEHMIKHCSQILASHCLFHRITWTKKM